MGATIKTFHFSSGWTAQYKSVSPQVLIAVQASVPWPEPIMQTVDYGDGPVQEANDAAPEYQAALREREIKVGSLLAAIYLDRGMLPLDEEQAAAVAELRADFQARAVTTLPADDKRCYLEYIACGRDGEIGEFFAAVRGISQPQEERIAAAVQSF